MYVSGLTLDEFKHITELVSEHEYDGNVTVAPDTTELGPTRFRARLKVKNSRAHGARLSWSGRHIPAASWEAYRDVLAAMFYAYPDTLVRTSMAVYRGLEGFVRDYPGTAYKNVGSMMEPAYMRELSL